MTPALRVVAPGLHTTLQDLVRRGFQDVGVPVSGPLDRVSLTLANALVGNPPDAAALELLAQGPTLEVLAHSVRLAVVGGNGGIDVLDDAELLAPILRSRVASRQSYPSQPLYLHARRIWRLRGQESSRRRHLARFCGCSKGWPRARFAVTSRSGAQAADPDRARPSGRLFLRGRDRGSVVLQVYDPPQADRMGYRLEGPQLEHTRGYNIVSDPIVAGSIQVPGSCQPIVLLADAQATGGYPKIGIVISADLPVLGRRRPGDLVRFTAIAQPEVEALLREQEAQVRRTIANLFEVKRGALLDAQALYETNLVSGMVDAFEGPDA
jgi:hypothetical protein